MSSQRASAQDRAAPLTPAPRAIAPWRLSRAEALPDYRVRVRFNDGVEGVVDLARLIGSHEAGVFSALRDARIFAAARVEHGVLTWPGEIDLAPDAMHHEIKTHGVWRP